MVLAYHVLLAMVEFNLAKGESGNQHIDTSCDETVVSNLVIEFVDGVGRLLTGRERDSGQGVRKSGKGTQVTNWKNRDAKNTLKPTTPQGAESNKSRQVNQNTKENSTQTIFWYPFH